MKTSSMTPKEDMMGYESEHDPNKIDGPIMVYEFTGRDDPGWYMHDDSTGWRYGPFKTEMQAERFTVEYMTRHRKR
jgi:hypothetical protein